MKPREYCCCAIPTVNAGIYTILTEQFILGILAGTLAVATPDIVGASTPSFAKWLFAIVCYVAAAVQVFGFLGVWKERPIMYRRYTTLHLLTALAAFAIAAVWIIVSATRHNQAKAKCEADFFANSTTSEGDTLCDVFPWVDIGIMAGLWVLLAIVQTYLYVVVSSYGTGQRIDHQKYDSLYDPTKPLTSDIPLSTRADPWDSHPSNQALMRDAAGSHSRHSSLASVSTVIADKQQQPVDFGGYGQVAYPPYPQAHTAQDPGPTPVANSYNSSAYGGMEAPARSQPHPGAS